MTGPARRVRPGVTYLEVSVALVVFAVALAGLCPLMLMQLKLLRKFEVPDDSATSLQVIKGVRMIDGSPLVAQGAAAAPVARVLRPQPDAWVRRLGIRASIEAAATAQAYALAPTRQTAAVGDPGFSALLWTPGQDPAQTGTGIFARSPGDLALLPATWSLSGIVPGYYRVLAIWPAAARNATDASYTLQVGGVPQNAPPAMDQQADPPPTGLGIYYLSGSLRVELEVSETGRVVADAIRIVPLNRVTIQGPVAPTAAGYQVTVGAVPQ